MIGDLLEPGQEFENQSASVDPVGPSDLGQDMFGSGLVQGHLLIGQRNDEVAFNLRGKFWCDAFVGFRTSQQERFY